MGRPTNNPKNYRVAARIDEKCRYILSAYCEKEKVTQMEAIRRAIERLEIDIKANK